LTGHVPRQAVGRSVLSPVRPVHNSFEFTGSSMSVGVVGILLVVTGRALPLPGGGERAGYRKPTGARLSARQKQKIWRLSLDGHSFRSIGKMLGVDERSVSAVCRGLRSSAGKHWSADVVMGELPDPRGVGELCGEARRALEDFGFFRARYFGRVGSPWQEAAAYRVLGLLGSPDKEFVVVNAPPGSGKSTLFTHDIPVWLACRDRGVRCLIGSRTFRQARLYTARLRRTFERVEVLPADEEEVGAGRAVVPSGSLVGDFGRFRPMTKLWAIWTRLSILVPWPMTVEPRVARSMAALAPISTSS